VTKDGGASLRTKVLALTLFLALVAFGVTFIETLPKLAGADDDGVGADDVLQLRFGEIPADPLARAPTPTAADDEARAALEEGIDYHVVREGDTLSSIAELRLGNAAYADDLGRLNELANPDRLEIGQTIWLR